MRLRQSWLVIVIGPFVIVALLVLMKEALLQIGDPHFADQACMWFGALLPVALVGVFRWPGVAPGVLAVWGTGVVAEDLLSALDPLRNENWETPNHIWMLFGWVYGLLYSLAILGVREGVRRLHKRLTAQT
jgi:hypothetical protein